jgi:hypothetical protein
MNTLAEEGFVVCGGPLAGTEHDRLRALLIVDAGDDAEIRRRFADDPWERGDRVVIASIESWNILTGTERLSLPRASDEPAALSSRSPSPVA